MKFSQIMVLIQVEEDGGSSSGTHKSCRNTFYSVISCAQTKPLPRPQTQCVVERVIYRLFLRCFRLGRSRRWFLGRCQRISKCPSNGNSRSNDSVAFHRFGEDNGTHHNNDDTLGSVQDGRCDRTERRGQSKRPFVV